MCCLFMQCGNTKNRPESEVVTGMWNRADSIARRQMENLGLPYDQNLEADSGLLIFFCYRPGDTSSLIQIKQQNNVFRGLYHEILPTYHHFVSDYRDTTSKLIFYEGYSFVLDSAQWKSIVARVNEIFQDKKFENTGLKWTDPSEYALYYGGQSRHGGPENRASFERFDKFLNNLFLGEFKQLRKPIFYKSK